MEVGKVEIGKVGEFDAKIEKGALVLNLGMNVGQAGVEGGLVVKVHMDVVLDVIAKAIPGQVDDAVIAVIKAAVAALG